MMLSGRAVASYSEVVWQKSSILCAQARGGGGHAPSKKKLQIRRSEITSLAILGSNMPGFPYIVAACPHGVEYM